MAPVTGGHPALRALNPRRDRLTRRANPSPKQHSPKQHSPARSTAQKARMDHEAHLDYRRVSPKLVVLRQIHNALGFGIGALLASIAINVVYLTTDLNLPEVAGISVLYAVPVGLVVAGIITAVIIPRQVRALGYREQRDDLLLRRGILFRQHTAVPYGRIQYVDIRQGPIQRSMGLTRIVITTAGGGTAAIFDGLPLAEAERLRDDLTNRGYARLAELGAS